MALGQLNMSGKNKVETAIKRIKSFEKVALRMSDEGYYVAYSGGKDSLVIAYLCVLAKVKFALHNNHTTVDAPELVYHIRDMKKWFKDNHNIRLYIHYPKRTMWQLIPDKLMPPTRLVRYCCDELKEGGGMNRFVITGVRWAESTKRKKNRQLVEFDRYGSQSKEAKENRKIFLNSDNHEKRLMMETCKIKGKHILNPIVDWTDGDVWEFINEYNLPYCKLYDEGFDRLGCIGCPMSGKKGMLKEFKKYPQYYKNYLSAFDRMLKVREEKELETNWKTAEEVMNWWIYGQ
ncbi:phosphoadenosine phosphosulfate reductase family protein [Clostridium botulinum]|uniref:phosphoadenosine phosphosulfate reductase family protein n=1 Tax=Clostridium botulinum TaxID=1491 RepID=UPI000FCC5D4B|nr:phosphoadenosine phosphosulfate reductase family protein [Clostridium botulinum]RUT55617.1 phosphoadenosine phosphosulfate reductase family protein [Clostridium botulinum]